MQSKLGMQCHFQQCMGRTQSQFWAAAALLFQMFCDASRYFHASFTLFTETWLEVKQLQRELNMSELALRGLQRRNVEKALGKMRDDSLCPFYVHMMSILPMPVLLVGVFDMSGDKS